MCDRDQFVSLVRQRLSCRVYDPARPVPHQAIETCLEAARLAPSACNQQPWRFIIVEDADLRKQIYEKGRLPGLAHTWLQDAPVIVALCVELDWVTHKVAPAFSGIPYYLLDAGIAGEHFVLAATEQGLGTCWIGWFKERAVKKILKVPRRVRIVSLLSLGYPASSDESSSRTPRKSIGQISTWNSWNHA